MCFSKEGTFIVPILIQYGSYSASVLTLAIFESTDSGWQFFLVISKILSKLFAGLRGFNGYPSDPYLPARTYYLLLYAEDSLNSYALISRILNESCFFLNCKLFRISGWGGNSFSEIKVDNLIVF